ncbi:hypothetical protein EV182_008619, partial [Spiromyces aspiralis]
PQLLIIDEIDGAHGPANSNDGLISILCKLAGNSNDSGAREPDRGPRRAKSDAKSDSNPMRPIICICNDLYTPVLRPLRQVAKCFQMNPPTPSQLVPKLQQICDAEGLEADTWSLMALAELSECDIRSCINTLQFLRARTNRLSINLVTSCN